jgi:hypothetical protein
MPNPILSDQDLNAFAYGLAVRFAARATGQDDESARLLYRRPSDHVLTGFLTPVSNNATGTGEDIDDQLVADLPRDAATEQTNLGIHWLLSRSVLQSDAVIKARIQLSIYVRRLPSREEQEQTQWSIPRAAARVHARTGGQQPRLQAEAIPVWTREDLGEIEAGPILLSNLWQQRRISIPLGDQVMQRLSGRNSDDLYPGRQPLVLYEDDVATDMAFTAWRATLPLGLWPLDWRPMLDVRLASVPTEPDLMRIAARVINRTSTIARSSLGYVDPNLYGVHLSLTLPEGAHRPTIFRELPQSFRYDRQMPAVGINAHAKLRREAGYTVLETESVPVYIAQRLEPRVIPGVSPCFDVLASDPLPTLQGILEAMRSYDVNDWAQAVSGQREPSERKEAEDARKRFQAETDRFARGIKLLANTRYPHVARAFSLLNRAMADANRGRFSEWRMFQIVFVVPQLPVLAGREYPELAEEGDDDVDILWFAAGGGKTEAFLGLILWQAFFDRLRGKTFGVVSFVRFPLRLLTFQQLQRLASALAAADSLRQAEGLRGARFSIGYFVGRGTTPNTIDDDTHHRYAQHGPDPKLQRLYRCPFCDAPTKVTYDATQRLVEHRCTQASSGCPNGNKRLPVYVVDFDLYRFLPTVIVSTVDKLAQFGQNQRFAQLMGRITVFCPEHGVSFLGANTLCPGAQALDRGERPTHCGSHLLKYGPFHDLAPSLLIQDELHLLSEELGTFDAHYETGVVEMVRSLGGQPWKVIAATATIENYKDHAWHLYLRCARQFPGPGPQTYESFYYTQSCEKIGRIFVGLLGVGRKHTPAVTRTLALIYLELQRARDLAAQDVRAACACYGLGNLDNAAFDSLVFLYELVLTYVLTRKGSDQVSEAIESRVKNDLQDVAPNHGELLVDTFNGGVSEAEMSAAVQRIRDASPQGRPEERLRGIVATNVIGHGVDVDRFNIMVFAGFPRLVAEYIQASARVGRTFPGLSFFVVTPQSERDRSVFDRFVKFHEYVDRLVDPSAITRWPESAMRRTVPGLLSGYLMGVAANQVGRRFSNVQQIQEAHAEGLLALLTEEVVRWLEQAYGADRAPSSERYRNQLQIVAQNRYSSVINQPRVRGGRPDNLNTFLEAMQSLRDTDDPAFITVGRPTEAAVLRRLIRA